HRTAVIGGRDARVLANDVHERPVRDPGAVRETPPAQDAYALALREARHDFGDQPGLADARIPDDRDEVPGALCGGPLDAVEELAQLACAADEGGRQRGCAAVRYRDGASRSQGPKCRHRLGPASRDDRVARFVLDRIASEAFGERADDDLIRFGSGL